MVGRHGGGPHQAVATKGCPKETSHVPHHRVRGPRADDAQPDDLSDRLITLAKEADTAGYTVTAEQLVQLAITIYDESPRRQV